MTESNAREQGIEINRVNFVKFLELTNLRGAIENREAIINVTPDNITVNLASVDKTCGLSGILKGKFLDWGILGLDDMSLLKKLVTTLTSDTINIKINKNKLILNDVTTKISAILRDPQYIKNTVSGDKFKLIKEKAIGNEFSLSSDIITKIINNTAILNASNLVIKGKDNKITFELESHENKILSEFVVEESITEFTLKLKNIFVDLLSTFKENSIIVSAQDGCPIYVKTESNNCQFEYVIAPLK